MLPAFAVSLQTESAAKPPSGGFDFAPEDPSKFVPVAEDALEPYDEYVIEPFEEPLEPFEEPAEAFEEPVRAFGEPVQPFDEPLEPFDEPLEPFDEPLEPFEEALEPVRGEFADFYDDAPDSVAKAPMAATAEAPRPVAATDAGVSDFVAAPAPDLPGQHGSERNTGVLFGLSGDPAPAPVVPVRSRRREIIFVTLAAMIGGIFTLGILLTRSGPAAGVAAVSAAPSPAAAPLVERAAPVSPTPVAQWTAANSALWAGGRKNTVAFEVEATSDVGVWMRIVRPALVVRCTAGSVEAFVYTASAAQIEPQTEEHTVQFSFDGGKPITQRWKDSVEHDALFAADVAGFLDRLLNARVMHFVFTPHNAAPANVQFSVAGLAQAIEPAKRQCGFKK